MECIENHNKVHEAREGGVECADLIDMTQALAAQSQLRITEQALIREVRSEGDRPAHGLGQEPQRVLAAIDCVDASDQHPTEKKEQNAEHNQPPASALTKADVSQSGPNPGQCSSEWSEACVRFGRGGHR